MVLILLSLVLLLLMVQAFILQAIVTTCPMPSVLISLRRAAISSLQVIVMPFYLNLISTGNESGVPIMVPVPVLKCLTALTLKLLGIRYIFRVVLQEIIILPLRVLFRKIATEA